MPKAKIQKWLGPWLLALAIVLSLAITTRVVFADPPTGTQGSPGKQASAPSIVVGQGVNIGYAQPNKPANPAIVLYDQYDNVTANATSAQNFEAANDAFDNNAADDFIVPAGPAWNVNMVEIDGAYFPGSTGPLVSVNIVFRNDAGGLPGGAVPGGTFMNQAYVNGPNAGDLIVNLPSSVTMGAGHYWMDVQGNMDFGAGGQWGWADRSVTSNTAAAWQNPGGGFGTACTPTWGIRSTTCGIDPANPDQVFRLSGSTGPTPTPPLVTDTPTPTFTVTLTRTPLSTPTCLPQLVIFDGSKQKPGVPGVPTAPDTNAKPAQGEYGFSEVAAKDSPGKAEYMAPDASFILAIDDGTFESRVGFGNATAGTETSAIWLNRFSPGAPLVLPYSIQNISIFWPAQGAEDPNSQTFYTQTPKLLIYADPTTGNGPSDAVLIYQADVTVGVTNTWATYNINPGVAITQTEDIYAGFLDQWANGGGYMPFQRSASLDTTIPHQLRSWISYGAGTTPPDFNNLGNNTNATIETASGGGITGNWGIRLSGNDARAGSCPPTNTPAVQNTFTPTRTFTITRTPTNTPQPCGANSNYSVSSSPGATIVPGTILVAGSQADDDNLPIDIGFPVKFYGLDFNTLNADTNGNLQFSSINSSFQNACLPAPTAGGLPMNNVIFAYWDDLDMTVTPTLGTSGIFTSVTPGSPRIFNIEYRACKYNAGTCGGDVNFEVRLYENSSRIDVIYNSVVSGGISATVGVQQRTGTASNYFTEFSCNSSSLSSGLMVTFNQTSCTPTATPTCPPLAGIKQNIGLNNPGEPNLVKAVNNGPNRFATSGKVASNPSKQASGFAPTLPINMVLDDGSRENAVSFGNNTAPTTSTAAIWLNRFSPGTYNLPMTITQISVLWPTTTGGTMIGKTTRLLVYLDANADNDPSDAVLQGQASVVINGPLETFENYAVSIPVAGNNGDVYIGFEDQWAENGGVSPRLFSSALDETRSQARSWLMGMSTGANPDLNNLGNNDFVATNDALGIPGNWMVRASGNTANRFCATPTPIYRTDSYFSYTHITFPSSPVVVTSTIIVPHSLLPSAQYSITEVEIVSLDMTDTQPARIATDLTGPTGRTVALFSGICMGTPWPDGSTGFGLADSASTPIGSQCPPGQATYKPQLCSGDPNNCLSRFIGQTDQGVWTLRMVVGAGKGGGIGGLNSWGLRITTMCMGIDCAIPSPTPNVVGHVLWPGTSQPNTRQQQSVTMTLCLDSTPLTYTATTDSSGVFSTTANLPTGIYPYTWVAKGARTLANRGVARHEDNTITHIEMGTMRAGDANNSNTVNVQDFSILKNTFGKASGDPGYDIRADFNNDNIVNAQDFTLLKNNFGQAGAAMTCSSLFR